MKVSNKLFQLCEQQIGKYTKSIGVDFKTQFPEKKVIRRKDIIHLYFSVVNTLVSKEDLEMLREVEYILQKNEDTLAVASKVQTLRLNIQNGKR